MKRYEIYVIILSFFVRWIACITCWKCSSIYLSIEKTKHRYKDNIKYQHKDAWVCLQSSKSILISFFLGNCDLLFTTISQTIDINVLNKVLWILCGLFVCFFIFINYVPVFVNWQPEDTLQRRFEHEQLCWQPIPKCG